MRRVLELERFYVFLSIVIVCALVGVTAAFFRMQSAGQQLTEVANRRLESYRLADELRHISDDLTRFVRTYVVTGDLRYKRLYDLVLGIRNGEIARPQDYYRVYWDLIVVDSGNSATLQLQVDGYHHLLTKPRPDGPAASLQQLMKHANFTEAEFAKLREAEAHFNSLVELEVKAMNSVRAMDAQGDYSPRSPAELEAARKLVHSTAYHAAKRNVMRPIDDFFVMLERRTADEVQLAETALARTQVVFVALVLLLFAVAAYLVWQVRMRALSQLGASPEHLEKVMGDIAAGHVLAAPSEPVGGLLAQAHMTANRLRTLIEDKEQLEEKVNVRSAELRQVMHQLVQTETLSALGSLVAGVAHELNTPLGNASVTASSLADFVAELRRAFDEKRIRKETMSAFLDDADLACDLLLRNVGRAASLISSLKQVAVDQTSARRRSTDLQELVNDTLQTLTPLYKRKPVSVEVDIPNAILLDTYPGVLEQVLTNLINNAVLHGLKEDDTLLIHVLAESSADGGALLVVRDDGLGMPPEVIEHAFEPFFTTKLGQGGSGLGLYLVHKLVSGTLGGEISMESALGTGTVFRIVLPPTAPHTNSKDEGH